MRILTDTPRLVIPFDDRAAVLAWFIKAQAAELIPLDCDLFLVDALDARPYRSAIAADGNTFVIKRDRPGDGLGFLRARTYVTGPLAALLDANGPVVDDAGTDDDGADQ